MQLCLDSGERPFHCPHCKTGFNRADVRAKHMKKIHRQAESGSGTPSQHSDQRPKPRHKERSKLACDQCRKRKLKCNNTRPCESCRSKLLNCSVSSSSRPPGRPRNILPVSPDNLSIRPTALSDSEIPPAPQPWTPDSLGPLLVRPTLIPNLAASRIPHSRDASDPYIGNIELSAPSLYQWTTAEAANNSLAQAFTGISMQIDQICEGMDLMNDLVPQPVGSFLCLLLPSYCH